MAVQTRTLEFATRGRDQVIDLTAQVRDLLRDAGLDEGVATIPLSPIDDFLHHRRQVWAFAPLSFPPRGYVLPRDASSRFLAT